MRLPWLVLRQRVGLCPSHAQRLCFLLFQSLCVHLSLEVTERLQRAAKPGGVCPRQQSRSRGGVEQVKLDVHRFGQHELVGAEQAHAGQAGENRA